jgi:diguanylate cyclase (GGDEF)-like protein
VSIAGRLALTSAAVIALTLGVGTHGLIEMRELNETTIRIAQERFEKVRLAQRGLQKLNENSRVVLHLFMVTDLSEFNRQLVQQTKTSREITELYDLFEQRIDAAEERILFGQVKSARARYAGLRAGAEGALQAGERMAAQSLIEREVLPALDSYIAAWNRLLELESRRLDDATREAAAGYARARLVAIGLFGLAAIIGTFVAVVVTRRITRPIAEIADAARRIEQGEPAPRVVVSSSDELGGLARAFNLMGEAVILRQEKLERQAALIERMSITDELTGLYNRRGFVILAGQHQELAMRESSPFAIMFADLNGLKKINDSMGHAVGDGALRRVAAVLKASVRDADIVARLGGDEFVILLHHADPTNVDLVGARVRQRLSEDTTPGVGVGTLSVSIGTAFYAPDHPASVAELLGEADRNMYVDKQRQRGFAAQ